MPKGIPVDLVGQRFGGWSVTERVGVVNNQVFWRCVCECGNTSDVTTRDLRGGRSTRCRPCGNTRVYNSRWSNG